MIYVDDEHSWLPRSGSERKVVDWWQEYWAANMDPVLTLELEEGEEPEADQDRPAKDAPPVKHILIFKRRH